MTEHPDPITDTPAQAAPGPRPRPRPWPHHLRSRNAILGAGALGLLALGFAGGAAAWSATRHEAASFDTALASTPIAELSQSSAVGITGQVEQIYGNKFVLSDGTARTLVETGRAGEGGRLVTAGETVTVQGRFDDGFLRAAALRHADQRIDELDPPPPRHGHGPGADRGPDGGPRRGGPAEID